MIRSLLRRFLDDDVLARSVVGAPVEDWLLLAAALVVTGVILVAARAAIHWRLRRDTGRTLAWAEQVVDNVLERTRGYFLFALALYFAARIAGWDARGLSYSPTPGTSHWPA